MTGDRMTADEAFEVLLAGNRRFVAGTPEHPNQDAARRRDVAPAQAPFAVLFGCSDSRLAAEIIFDRGLGDLFVVRTAGHVMGPEVLGSIEYGWARWAARWWWCWATTRAARSRLPAPRSRTEPPRRDINGM